MISQKDIFEKLHQEKELLYYLRMHPKWYKILYYSPSKLAEFTKEAKVETKQTIYHKIEDVTNKIEMINFFVNTLVNS